MEFHFEPELKKWPKAKKFSPGSKLQLEHKNGPQEIRSEQELNISEDLKKPKYTIRLKPKVVSWSQNSKGFPQACECETGT